jgi:peptidoglycan/LPS O-acetylase OafA/YrhL
MGLLRLWLASIVLVGHAGVNVGSRGPLAVSAFFVLSGFLIQLVISEHYATRERRWIGRFYCSRALRIFPLYYLFVILTLPLALTGNQVLISALATGNHWTQSLTVLANVLLFGQDAFRFLQIEMPSGALVLLTHLPAQRWIAANYLSILGQAWSLSIELSFYAIAPFILTRSSRVLIVVAALSLLVRLAVSIMIGPQGNPDFNWAFFPSEIATFVLGSLAYRLYRAQTTATFTRLPAVVALAVIVLYTYYFDVLSLAGERLAAGGFCFLVAAMLPSLEAATRRNRVDRFIGTLSYPIYIGHITVLTAMMAAGIAPGAACASALWIVTIAVSIALVKYVETPLTRFRQRFRGPPLTLGSSTGVPATVH